MSRKLKDGLVVDVDEMCTGVGVVEGSSATLLENNIDDPEQIIGVTDEFSAYDAACYSGSMVRSRRQQKAVEGASSPDPKVE